MNESLFTFFSLQQVDDLIDNPVLIKMLEKKILIDTLTIVRKGYLYPSVPNNLPFLGSSRI